MKLKVNGKPHEVDVPEDVPLLWILREELGLTGTKFGCGRALCGACTVHIDGKAARSCVTATGSCAGKEVTTIEGLANESDLHPVQQAWIEENVPQCGYCQSGQIMAAVALLSTKADPSDAEIDAVMSANLCRCGTYPRIRKAIRRAVELTRNGASAPAAEPKKSDGKMKKPAESTGGDKMKKPAEPTGGDKMNKPAPATGGSKMKPAEDEPKGEKEADE